MYIEYFAYMSICVAKFVSGAHKGQEGHHIPLELELHTDNCEPP